MKVLELFAGSRSFSKVAEEFGYETYTTDIEPFEKINQVCSIFDFNIDKMLDEFGAPDIIWASPPCTTFSVASIGHHWKGGNRAYIPKTKEAEIGIKIIEETNWLIKMLNPKYFYIENPRGLLRKLPVITKENYIRHTIWYCQYHNPEKDKVKRAKPTDIWTNDYKWKPKPVCKNGNPDCNHERAPRGSRTGTQGLKDNYERSKVPYELCKDIIKNIEKNL
jgi:hypothetical protein|tara:strand:- start:265 stop:927 length:663 start_codon:yes stop_codon:yes gene_type:complete